MHEKSTHALQQELMAADDLHSFLRANRDGLIREDLSAFLHRRMEQRRLSLRALAEGAWMSSLYLEQLLAGRRDPSRDRLLRLSAALTLPPEEADELLVLSGLPPLDPENSRDALLLSLFARGASLGEAEDALFSAGEAPLL